MKVILVALLLCTISGVAQTSAPLSKKQVVLFNALNVGASFANARTSWYGAHQCVVREELHRDPKAKFTRTLEISLPIDAVVAYASCKLHKKHRSWSMAIPLMSASAQSGMAVTQFSAGCF